MDRSPQSADKVGSGRSASGCHVSQPWADGPSLRLIWAAKRSPGAVGVNVQGFGVENGRSGWSPEDELLVRVFDDGGGFDMRDLPALDQFAVEDGVAAGEAGRGLFEHQRHILC